MLATSANNTTAANTVTVSIVETEMFEPLDAVRRFRKLLSGDELETHRQYVHSRDRHLYLISHAMLRIALSKDSSVAPAEWEFCRSSLGKPRIAAPRVNPRDFSLSHTSGLTVCAVSNVGPLGIDVESHTSAARLTTLASRVFSREEQIHLARTPTRDRGPESVWLWTLKEALLKAIGTGLHTPMVNVSVPLDGSMVRGQKPTQWCGDESLGWHFVRLRIDSQFECALAVPRSPLGPAPIHVVRMVPPDFAPQPVTLSRLSIDDWHVSLTK
jgi:4'-phosphopantetheinyl transferase